MYQADSRRSSLLIPVDVWRQLKWLVGQLFVNPLLVLLLVGGVIALTELIGSGSWKRRVKSLAAVLALTYLVIISPAGAALAVRGLTLWLPPDSGKTADAIVVLGRGPLLNPRVDVAAQLWQAGRAPQIFASGRAEAPVLLKVLRAKGVPSDRLWGEVCSRTTAENALLTAPLLRSQDVERIILVTDSPHMLRSSLIFSSLGFDVIPHPTPLPTWLTSAQVSRLALTEYIGLAVYTALGRFQPQSPHVAQISNSRRHWDDIRDGALLSQGQSNVIQSNCRQIFAAK